MSVHSPCYYAWGYIEKKNIVTGYNPAEKPQQHLCPRKLITLNRCRKAGLNFKKTAYLLSEAMRVMPAFPLNMQHQQASQNVKSLKRINYCKCNCGSQACNTRHIFEDPKVAFGQSIVRLCKVTSDCTTKIWNRKNMHCFCAVNHISICLL